MDADEAMDAGSRAGLRRASRPLQRGASRRSVGTLARASTRLAAAIGRPSSMRVDRAADRPVALPEWLLPVAANAGPGLDRWRDRDLLALRRAMPKHRARPEPVAPRGLPMAAHARGRSRAGTASAPGGLGRRMTPVQRKLAPNEAHADPATASIVASAARGATRPAPRPPRTRPVAGPKPRSGQDRDRPRHAVARSAVTRGRAPATRPTVARTGTPSTGPAMVNPRIGSSPPDPIARVPRVPAAPGPVPGGWGRAEHQLVHRPPTSVVASRSSSLPRAAMRPPPRAATPPAWPSLPGVARVGAAVRALLPERTPRRQVDGSAVPAPAVTRVHGAPIGVHRAGAAVGGIGIGRRPAAGAGPSGGTALRSSVGRLGRTVVVRSSSPPSGIGSPAPITGPGSGPTGRGPLHRARPHLARPDLVRRVVAGRDVVRPAPARRDVPRPVGVRPDASRSGVGRLGQTTSGRTAPMSAAPGGGSAPGLPGSIVPPRDLGGIISRLAPVRSVAAAASGARVEAHRTAATRSAPFRAAVPPSGATRAGASVLPTATARASKPSVAPGATVAVRVPVASPVRSVPVRTAPTGGMRPSVPPTVAGRAVTVAVGRRPSGGPVVRSSATPGITDPRRPGPLRPAPPVDRRSSGVRRAVVARPAAPHPAVSSSAAVRAVLARRAVARADDVRAAARPVSMPLPDPGSVAARPGSRVAGLRSVVRGSALSPLARALRPDPSRSVVPQRAVPRHDASQRAVPQDVGVSGGRPVHGGAAASGVARSALGGRTSATFPAFTAPLVRSVVGARVGAAPTDTAPAVARSVARRAAATGSGPGRTPTVPLVAGLRRGDPSVGALRGGVARHAAPSGTWRRAGRSPGVAAGNGPARGPVAAGAHPAMIGRRPQVAQTPRGGGPLRRASRPAVPTPRARADRSELPVAVTLLTPGRGDGAAAPPMSPEPPTLARRAAAGGGGDVVRAADLAAALGDAAPAASGGGGGGGGGGRPPSPLPTAGRDALVARSTVARSSVARSGAAGTPARSGGTVARRGGSALESFFGRRSGRAAPVHPNVPSERRQEGVDEVIGSIAAISTSATPSGGGVGAAPLTTSQLLDLKDWINRAVDDRLRAELERRGVLGGRW